MIRFEAPAHRLEMSFNRAAFLLLLRNLEKAGCVQRVDMAIKPRDRLFLLRRIPA
jgi:hypothetical protein